jgi:DNA-binding NarL/FixJ family response regulator
LVDIECNGGIRAVSDICAASPETAVVVLTASRARDDFFDALRAGAIGYLPKDVDAEWLPNALRGVLAGEAAIPRTLVASLVNEFRSRNGRRTVTGRNGDSELTPQEWEVAHMLAHHSTTKEIAGRLGVSPVTVRRHVSSIVSKLEVPDREAAVELLESAGRS